MIAKQQSSTRSTSQACWTRDSYLTTGDYRYHFEQEAKERFLGLLRERFNSGVKYMGRALK